jgi:hypothetical protein
VGSKNEAFESYALKQKRTFGKEAATTNEGKDCDEASNYGRGNQNGTHILLENLHFLFEILSEQKKVKK